MAVIRCSVFVNTIFNVTKRAKIWNYLELSLYDCDYISAVCLQTSIIRVTFRCFDGYDKMVIRV